MAFFMFAGELSPFPAMAAAVPSSSPATALPLLAWI
jgi:hypothetical protein